MMIIPIAYDDVAIIIIILKTLIKNPIFFMEPLPLLPTKPTPFILGWISPISSPQSKKKKKKYKKVGDISI
jgi:uncharacterized membrane protein